MICDFCRLNGFHFFTFQVSSTPLSDSSNKEGTESSTSVTDPTWVDQAQRSYQGLHHGDVVQILPDGGYGTFQHIVMIPTFETALCVIKLAKVSLGELGTKFKVKDNWLVSL